jgi:hypothetical protein
MLMSQDETISLGTHSVQGVDAFGDEGAYEVEIHLLRNASHETAVDLGMLVEGKALFFFTETYSDWPKHKDIVSELVGYRVPQPPKYLSQVTVLRCRIAW